MPSVPPPLILAHHGVSDVPAHLDPEGLFVSPAQLRRQIGRLRRWGYRFATFGELAERAARRQAHGHVALTFDDGLADNLTELVPVLDEQGVPATVFVTTGWLGEPHPSVPFARIMTAEQVAALHGAGVEIGAHTVTHPDMTTLDPPAMREEVRTSAEQLRAITGGPVDVFAYPFGFVNDTVARATADAGMRAACGVAGRGSWDDPLRLPRQDTNTKSALGLWLKRDDRYEAVMRHLPARALRRLGKERRWLVSRLRRP